MKINLNKYIYLAVTLLGISCNKELLNTIPNDRITSNIFWTTEKDAIIASNALYTFLDGTEQLHRDVFTDIAHTNTQYGDYKAIELGSYNALNSVIEAEWVNDYKGIRAANYFLENVDKIETINVELITRLTGEARFLRAYFYVKLVFIYGNIPLITKTLTIEESRSLTQSTATEVWDFIFNELNQAANELPLVNSDKGRITKGAALALNARAMLFAKRYDESASLAKSVMDLNVYNLSDSYASLFSYTGENNDEIILNKEFIRDVYSNNVMSLLAPFSIMSNGVVMVPLKKIVDSYEMTNGKRIDEAGSGFDPYNPYKNRDHRLSYSVYVPGDILPDGRLFDSRPNSGAADAVGSNYQVSVTGFYVKKYINKEDMNDLSNCGINIILLRYAEVLLTYAEAKVELNQIDGTVYDAIDLIRSRTDVNMPLIARNKSQVELRELIRQERMVELAFEGQRFFDIRRWGIAPDVFNVLIQGLTYVNSDGQLETVDQPGNIRRFEERDYLWPIPQKEMDLNKSLNQNPGW